MKIKLFQNEKVLDYYTAYAKHFKIFDKIRFETTVLKASNQQQNGKWTIQFSCRGHVQIEEFDAMIVCSGLYSKPNFPKIQNQSLFNGQIIQ